MSREALKKKMELLDREARESEAALKQLFTQHIENLNPLKKEQNQLLAAIDEKLDELEGLFSQLEENIRQITHVGDQLSRTCEYLGVKHINDYLREFPLNLINIRRNIYEYKKLLG